MLTTIREKTQGIIAGFIITLIIIPFALWGVNSYFEGGPSQVVAKAGDVEISQRLYRDSLDRYRGQVPPAALESAFFKQQIIENLVAENLLVLDARELGYRIGDRQLSESIRALPYFQRDNQFDPELYKAALRAQGTSVSSFEESMRNDAIGEQVHSGFKDSALVTGQAIDSVARLLMQQREAAYVTISPAPFVKTAKVEDQAIQDYYAANKGQYMTPEQVQVDYLVLSAVDLASDFKPTEKELLTAYDEGIGQDKVAQEKRRASHILLEVAPDATKEQEAKVLEQIQGLKKQLSQGADFAILAREHSQDTVSAKKGGDLGVIEPGMMVKEFEQAAYALQKGEISQPVRTKFGYHLLRLTEVTPAVRKPFQAVRQQITDVLKRQHGEERFFDLSENFYNAVYEQPDSLEPAAKKLGLKVRKSEWFPRAGGTGVLANPKVAGAAFEPEVLEQGRNSETIEVDGTTLVALRVTGHRKAEPKTLASVRQAIVSVLKQRDAEAQAVRLLNQVQEAVKQGEGLAAVASKHALTYHKPRLMAREGGLAKGLDKGLLDAVFQAPAPGADRPSVASASLGANGHAVFVLQRVIDGQAAKADEATRARAKQKLVRRQGVEYFESYRQGLRKSTDVRIYTENL